MKVMKYLALPMDVVLIEPYTLECRIFKGLIARLSLIVWKHKPMLFAFNVQFAKQQKCVVIFFAKICITHHISEHINFFHVQIIEATVLELERTISCGRLYQVDHIYFMHLCKSRYVMYKLSLCSVIGIALLLQAFRKHLFRLNYTFKSFDTKLLIKRKLACNLDTWNVFLTWIWLILCLMIISMMIDPISMTSTTLSSFIYALRVAIISYVWNVTLCKVICFAAFKSMIHFHVFLECAILRITHA